MSSLKHNFSNLNVFSEIYFKVSHYMLHETFYPLFHGTQAAIIKNGNDFYTRKGIKLRLQDSIRNF